VLWLSSVLYLFFSNVAGLVYVSKRLRVYEASKAESALSHRYLLSAGNTKSKAKKQSKHIICSRVTTLVYTTMKF